MQVGIDNSHIGQKLIVGKRILDARTLVGYDGERRNFRAGAGGSRYCDKVSFFAHFRESVYALSDVHKTHSHIHKVDFGMFVHNPHNLCGVHCASASERDYRVGSERRHLFCALFGTFQSGVGSDVGKGRMRDAEFVEFIGNALGKSVFV